MRKFAVLGRQLTQDFVELEDALTLIWNGAAV
ncbi:hypothetical protein ROE7235_03236 [Roseibaca ekhonensis]|jgi:hypothetical protein|uniref:Uncharacterized protein n=1 Tax=Roseinatronobacter ekhonensis TaxID=254356 RepID=A0A3B0N0A1_9RHOB|nr:hypothetical protein ROE7235_03236 [Roseibaca ekhonensis]